MRSVVGLHIPGELIPRAPPSHLAYVPQTGLDHPASRTPVGGDAVGRIPGLGCSPMPGPPDADGAIECRSRLDPPRPLAPIWLASLSGWQFSPSPASQMTPPMLGGRWLRRSCDRVTSLLTRRVGQAGSHTCGGTHQPLPRSASSTIALKAIGSHLAIEPGWLKLARQRRVMLLDPLLRGVVGPRQLEQRLGDAGLLAEHSTVSGRTFAHAHRPAVTVRRRTGGSPTQPRH